MDEYGVVMWSSTSTIEATDWVFMDVALPAPTEPKTPHPRFRQYLESAARKLGPERCQQALRSYDGRDSGSWESCALASAYGEYGELQRLSDEAGDSDCGITAARVLGLSLREVVAVMNSYDGRYGEMPREVLKSFLTLEAAKQIPHQRTEPVRQTVTAS